MVVRGGKKHATELRASVELSKERWWALDKGTILATLLSSLHLSDALPPSLAKYILALSVCLMPRAKEVLSAMPARFFQ